MPISSTFYEELLHAQIPKAQTDSQFKQLFGLLGSASVKAAHKHIDEIDPWIVYEFLKLHQYEMYVYTVCVCVLSFNHHLYRFNTRKKYFLFFSSNFSLAETVFQSYDWKKVFLWDIRKCWKCWPFFKIIKSGKKSFVNKAGAHINPLHFIIYHTKALFSSLFMGEGPKSRKFLGRNWCLLKEYGQIKTVIVSKGQKKSTSSPYVLAFQLICSSKFCLKPFTQGPFQDFD